MTTDPYTANRTIEELKTALFITQTQLAARNALVRELGTAIEEILANTYNHSDGTLKVKYSTLLNAKKVGQKEIFLDDTKDTIARAEKAETEISRLKQLVREMGSELNKLNRRCNHPINNRPEVQAIIEE